VSYLDVNNITADVTDAQLQASYDAHVNTLKGLMPELVEFNEEASWAAKCVCEDLQKVLDAIARRWLAIGHNRQGGFASEVLADMMKAQGDAIQAQAEWERYGHLEVG